MADAAALFEKAAKPINDVFKAALTRREKAEEDYHTKRDKLRWSRLDPRPR